MENESSGKTEKWVRKYSRCGDFWTTVDVFVGEFAMHHLWWSHCPKKNSAMGTSQGATMKMSAGGNKAKKKDLGAIVPGRQTFDSGAFSCFSPSIPEHYALLFTTKSSNLAVAYQNRLKVDISGLYQTYWRWKKPCTTLDGWNPINNGMFTTYPLVQTFFNRLLFPLTCINPKKGGCFMVIASSPGAPFF